MIVGTFCTHFSREYLLQIIKISLNTAIVLLKIIGQKKRSSSMICGRIIKSKKRKIEVTTNGLL